MKNKFVLSKIQLTVITLFLLSVIFSLLGIFTLRQTDYRFSDYFSDFNINNDIFKSTLNITPNSFKFKLDFNLSDYCSSNYYSLPSDTTELNFNFTSQDIEIVNYPEDTLNIEINSDYSDDVELSINKTDNKLFFNTKYNTPSNAKIIIRVPESFTYGYSINLSTSSGRVDVSNFRSHSLKITTANGKIDLNDSSSLYLYLTTSSGNITFDNLYTSFETSLASNSGKIKGSGYFGSLISNNVSGNTVLDFKDLGTSNNINSKFGAIKLTMPEDAGYKVDFSTTSGSYKSSTDLLSSGDESSDFYIKTVHGNLFIYK